MGEIQEKPKQRLIPGWEGSGSSHFPAVTQLGSLEGRTGRKNMQDGAVSVYELVSMELNPWDAAGIGNVLPPTSSPDKLGTSRLSPKAQFSF